MTRSLLNSKQRLKNLWLLLALGLSTPLLIIFTISAKTSRLVFTGNFETGDFSGWEQQFCCRYSGEIVNSPIRAGNYAAKFTLTRNDPIVENGKRAELKRNSISPAGSEYWYGFSIYLPIDWVEDTTGEIVAQWHDLPDFWFGEKWKSPPVSLDIDGKNWKIKNIWDSKIVTPKRREPPVKEIIWSGTLKKGAWTDWVFHIKWSYKSDGLFEVWKDGVRIVNKRGPNTYNDLLAPYLKIGPYKNTWRSKKTTSIVDKRTIYYDEVRVGNASASYTDVAPR